MSFLFGFIVGAVVALIVCAIRLAFLVDAWFEHKGEASKGSVLPPS